MKKRCFNIITVVALFLFTAQSSLAQLLNRDYYSWAMISYNEKSQEAVASQYKAKAEIAPNGKVYCRISWFLEHLHNDECKLSRYGFAKRDMRVYLYDFETGEESVCLDYNLQKGETFTTYNGETWEVVETKDTLIQDYLVDHLCYEQTHKLLTMYNMEDGRIDKWLEGFGSFTNHLMIEKVQPGVSSYQLWQRHKGRYIINEFSADPLFGHDTGWLQAETWGEEKEKTTLEYKDGQLMIDDQYFSWPSRYYDCYLRKGDVIFGAYGIELEPHIDGGESALRSNIVHLKGLPEPASGSYTVHWGDKILTTGIHSVDTDTPTTHAIFDLQGRKLNAAPAHGIYIKDGVKRLNK